MLGETPVKLLDWKPPSTQTIDGLSFNTKFFILCQPSPYRNLDDAKGLPPTSLHILPSIDHYLGYQVNQV